jgi:tight adherence protein B
MVLLAIVIVVLGVGLVAITITAESLRRQRLRAFFAGEVGPRRSDVVVAALRQLPINRTSGLILLGAVAAGVLLAIVADSVLLGGLLTLTAIAVPLALRARNRRRQQQLLRSQMADALESIASSMTAGSSFMRSLYELSGDAREPLAGELDLVLNEIDVGVTPADAFRSMAERTGLGPAAWLSHLLRVQETTGAPLVHMLKALADHVKQGDGIQREVRALTAEGRMSAYVIAALPIALVLVLEVTDPDYLDVYTSGWGIAVSVGMVISVCLGLFIVTRMVNSMEV